MHAALASKSPCPSWPKEALPQEYVCKVGGDGAIRVLDVDGGGDGAKLAFFLMLMTLMALR